MKMAKANVSNVSTEKHKATTGKAEAEILQQSTDSKFEAVLTLKQEDLNAAKSALASLNISVYSKTHQQRIRRLLPFAICSDRVQAFSTIAQELDWGPGKQVCFTA